MLNSCHRIILYLLRNRILTEATFDHEGRLSRLEGINEQINHRLDQMQQQMNQMQQQMNQQFRWLVGIQLTTLLALGTLILSKLPG
ncbi:MAG: hypothetical protein OXE49_17415 [Gemmatimonadetes bacterium]|nr:hypothetical protein [Gemmatimonadota bacterium]